MTRIKLLTGKYAQAFVFSLALWERVGARETGMASFIIRVGCLAMPVAAFVVFITLSLPVAAKTYKWVDDKGVTHVGDTIPPEYAGRNRIELDKSGRAVKKEGLLTPEERSASEQEEKKKIADEQAELERKRRDKALLNTYSDEKEIDLARKRNLQQVEIRINSLGARIKIIDNSLIGLKKEAENYNKAGKNIPASLQADIKESQGRMIKLQQDMDKSKAEKDVIDAQFDADKKRYKELTGK